VSRGGKRQGQGRKAQDGAKAVQRVNTSLDAATIAKARKLGDGNLSAGIRKAVNAV
jgi:hypothetical protein